MGKDGLGGHHGCNAKKERSGVPEESSLWNALKRRKKAKKSNADSKIIKRLEEIVNAEVDSVLDSLSQEMIALIRAKAREKKKCAR